jgi:hypothetical protein
MLIVHRAPLRQTLRQSMSDVHVLRAVPVLFAGVQKCILGGAQVEEGRHDEMMSDEQRAEADVSFLVAGEFAYMVAACGSGGKRRVVRSSNRNT